MARPDGESTMTDPIVNSIAIFVIVLSQWAAWDLSARQISRECDKLGAFFVGDKVYDCKSRAAIGRAK